MSAPHAAADNAANSKACSHKRCRQKRTSKGLPLKRPPWTRRRSPTCCQAAECTCNLCHRSLSASKRGDICTTEERRRSYYRAKKTGAESMRSAPCARCLQAMDMITRQAVLLDGHRDAMIQPAAHSSREAFTVHDAASVTPLTCLLAPAHVRTISLTVARRPFDVESCTSTTHQCSRRSCADGRILVVNSETRVSSLARIRCAKSESRAVPTAVASRVLFRMATGRKRKLLKVIIPR